MKNIKKATIVALGVYVSAAQAHTTGYSHEPDGFGGIHWGDPVPTWMRPSCTIIDEDTFCEPEKAAPSVTINGRRLALTSLVYKFWRNRFESVAMDGPKAELEPTFVARFGPATSSEPLSYGRSFFWEGARTEIQLSEGGQPGGIDETQAQVEVGSAKLLNEWAQEQRKARKKSDL